MGYLALAPAAAAAIGGLASKKGIGGFMSGVMGSNNDYHADPYAVDQSAYQYGGAPDGAQKAADQYGDLANNAAEQANGAYSQQLQSREQMSNVLGQQQGTLGQQQAALGQQQGATSLAQMAAMGNAPSRAEILGGAMSDQAAAAQQSLAASARGPAALALAQQNAAANTANAQANIATSAMGQRADEMAQARNAYGQMASMQQQGAGSIQNTLGGMANTFAGMRGQDLSALQGDRQQQQTMLASQQGVNTTQLNASMARDNAKQNAYNNAAGINSGVASQNAATNAKAGADVMNMAGKAMGGGGGGGGGGGDSGGAGMMGGAAASAGGGGGAGAGVAGGAGGLGAMAAGMSTESQKVPVSGGMGALMASPEGTKDPILVGGDDAYYGGKQLMIDDAGRGMLAEPQQRAQPGTFAAFAQQAGGMSGRAAKEVAPGAQAQATRKPTTEEASRWADAELDKLRGEMGIQPHSAPSDSYEDLGARADAMKANMKAGGKAPSFISQLGAANRDATNKIGEAGDWLNKKASDLVPAPVKNGARAADRGVSRVKKASEEAADQLWGAPKVQTQSGREFPAPDHGAMEDYLASTRGGLYQYKNPAMPGASQGPNYGPPSAEDMTTNPVGRVVTTVDPRTGNLAIDHDKAMKANMSGLSYVNDKVNRVNAALAASMLKTGSRR